MNNKKLIRLTESDLHRIVKESVNKVLNEVQLNELDPRTYASYADGRWKQAKAASRNYDYDKARELEKKSEEGREAARNAWNWEWGTDDYDGGDYRKMGANGDNYLVDIRQDKKGIKGRFNPYERDYQGRRNDNEFFNRKTGKEERNVPEKFGGYRVARQMANGTGKYRRGKWE